jgi:hypothetical protein
MEALVTGSALSVVLGTASWKRAAGMVDLGGY